MALAGDSDVSDEEQPKEGVEQDADGEEDQETDGLVAPPDAIPSHFEEECYGSDGGESSEASSGLEDCDELEHEQEEEQEDEQVLQKEENPAEQSATSAEAAAGKIKAFHVSPEWKQLIELGKEKKCDLTLLPVLTGAGISRHPAKSFWSVRYPFQPIKAVCWGGTTGRTALESCVKCMRHLIKLHISAQPHDENGWKTQLQILEELSQTIG